ncbi:hypothetical protein Gogos_009462 [Gossypium gossypioides]|uniref:RNase H type-1 domain-containing protein n=1 Tax=Gossypium gossypioides TaxID=34282 RepID=A0A7J9CER7_GOSGO|nr:hypothetical protein [Gossypium gossypioides]
MLFHSKIRALMWARAVHEECQFLEGDWWSWPVKCRASLNMKNTIVSHWESPPTEWMKFNVVGVVLEEIAIIDRKSNGMADALAKAVYRDLLFLKPHGEVAKFIIVIVVKGCLIRIV